MACTCPDLDCAEHGENASIDDELELARAAGVLVGDDANDEGHFLGRDLDDADDDLDEVIR